MPRPGETKEEAKERRLRRREANARIPEGIRARGPHADLFTKTNDELKVERDRVLSLDSQRELLPDEEGRLRAVVTEAQRRKFVWGPGDVRIIKRGDQQDA